MAYNPTEWKNREVEKPRTFTVQNNADGTITLTPSEGTITEPGTPIMADNMNKIEQGLVKAVNHVENETDHVYYGNDNFPGRQNEKAVSINPAITTYKKGLGVSFTNSYENTGPVTINVNGLGFKQLLKSNGQQLAGGALKANSVYTVRYNGVNFTLQGEGGEYGTAVASDVLTGKTLGTENGVVNGTIPIKSAATITPGTTNQTIDAGRYLSGVQTILGDADLIPTNIRKAINIFGVVGTLEPVNVAFGTTTTTNDGNSTIFSITGINFNPKVVILYNSVGTASFHTSPDCWGLPNLAININGGTSNWGVGTRHFVSGFYAYYLNVNNQAMPGEYAYLLIG